MSLERKAGVAASPCGSCPYRKDVPSGVWEAHEYDKLPAYDGEIVDQALAGAHGLFMCHQKDGNLCAGWLATHGPLNLLAMRLHAGKVKPEVWDYKSPVPVFKTGAEAAKHGKRQIKRPGQRARRTIDRLIKKRGKKDA